MKNVAIDPKNTRMDFGLTVVNHLLYSFEEEYGKEELRKLIEGTGMPLEFFEKNDNWVSYEYFCNLLKAMVEYTGDPKTPYTYGLNAVRFIETWGILKTIMNIFPSPITFYKNCSRFIDHWARVGNFRLLFFKRNKAVIDFRLKDDLKQDKNNCLNVKGQLCAVPTFWNLPYAKITETQCAAEGADSCIYEVRWINYAYKRLRFYALLGGLIVVYLSYLLLQWEIISIFQLSILSIMLIPVAFFWGGRIIDYKRTLNDNIRMNDEQNLALIDSLVSVEKLNEELLQKVEERTEELQKTNEELQKRLAELKASRDHLIHEEKMATVGQLAAGMAHELNNPVGAVRSYVQDVLEDISNDDLRWDHLNSIVKSTSECKDIVNELLSFSRESDSLSLIDLDFNEILEIITTKIKVENPYLDVTILKELSPNLPTIKADSMQMKQVFIYIFRKAMEPIKKEGRIFVKTNNTADNVIVEISNNDKCVSEDDLNIAFDPFSIKKEYGERSALGLAISYNIIKRFNGDMIVNNESGRGTKYTVIIPYNQ
ncbi:MAG: histidine kinase dimerization/phospho-acceptor domain-containing protein [Spirochaetota bacterium]|nr:histidine kinase dimerization/phospho-acceptor domain-containing protein [Spirochaetota bacterium]